MRIYLTLTQSPLEPLYYTVANCLFRRGDGDLDTLIGRFSMTQSAIRMAQEDALLQGLDVWGYRTDETD